MSGASLSQIERQHLLDPTNSQIIDSLFHHSERLAWTFEGQTMGAWIRQCRDPDRVLRWRAAQSLERIGVRAIPGLLLALDQSDDPGPYLPLCLLKLSIPEFFAAMIRRTKGAHPRTVRACLCALSSSLMSNSVKMPAITEVAQPQCFFEVRHAYLEIGDEAGAARNLYEEQAQEMFGVSEESFNAAPTLVQDFEKSWRQLLLSFEDKTYRPLRTLLSHLRILGYDQVLRAGTSMFYVIFSRSRTHGMGGDQDWIAINAKPDGTMSIRLRYSDPSPIEIPKVMLCDELITRLERLAQQPIND
ncbi:MAG: hypothetical protein P1V97_07360 [Planctomycetota bacterium]|nr:hypothetical protein [Planctomycetota bacterium]